jgi:uncharacterized protein YbbC (DUF1343 family)
MPKVRTGLDILVAQDFAPLREMRVGLGHASRRRWTRAFGTFIDLFSAAKGVTLGAVFGPEHGLLGQAQDLIGLTSSESKQATSVPVYSLYGSTPESLRPSEEQLKESGRAGHRHAGRRQPLLHLSRDHALLHGRRRSRAG